MHVWQGCVPGVVIRRGAQQLTLLLGCDSQAASSVLVETLSGACPSAEWACSKSRLPHTQKLISAAMTAAGQLLQLREYHKRHMEADSLSAASRGVAQVVVELGTALLLLLLGRASPSCAHGWRFAVDSWVVPPDLDHREPHAGSPCCEWWVWHGRGAEAGVLCPLAALAGHRSRCLVVQLYSTGSAVLAWVLDCTRTNWAVSNLTLDFWYYLAESMEKAPASLQVEGCVRCAMRRRPLHLLTLGATTGGVCACSTGGLEIAAHALQVARRC